VTPSRRAAGGFCQGAVVAAVAQLVAVPVAAGFGALPFGAVFGPVIRLSLPVAGYAFAGALGASALGLGSRASRFFALGGVAAGIVFTLTSTNLSGLTGFENPAVVVAYAAAASAGAFGAFGGVAGLGMPARQSGRDASRSPACRMAAVFGLAGVAGGVTGMAPFLLARTRVLPDELLAFAWLAASFGAVAVPLCVGGAVIGGWIEATSSADGEQPG
jgi:hypothetical protein